MTHAEKANYQCSWHWIWRKLYCLNRMGRASWGEHYQESFEDAGYCLDRYTLEN